MHSSTGHLPKVSGTLRFFRGPLSVRDNRQRFHRILDCCRPGEVIQVKRALDTVVRPSSDHLPCVPEPQPCVLALSREIRPAARLYASIEAARQRVCSSPPPCRCSTLRQQIGHGGRWGAGVVWAAMRIVAKHIQAADARNLSGDARNPSTDTIDSPSVHRASVSAGCTRGLVR